MVDEKPFDLHKFILQWLRRGSYRMRARTIAMTWARVSRGKYNCAKCNKTFGRKEIQVDHLIPVVDPLIGFVDWETYINRLFVDAAGLQILCKPCHKEKSKSENEIRREVKKKTLQSVSKKRSIKKGKKL